MIDYLDHNVIRNLYPDESELYGLKIITHLFQFNHNNRTNVSIIQISSKQQRHKNVFSTLKISCYFDWLVAFN